MKFSVKLIFLKIITSIIFILILPLIITWYLYPGISLGDCSGKKEIITSAEISRLSAKSIFADILQIPLNLKWYNIHIFAKDLNCKKPASIFLAFIEGDPEKYSTSSLLKPPFLGEFFVDPVRGVFKIPEDGKGQFTYLTTDLFSIGPIRSGCSEPITTEPEELKKLPGVSGFICNVYAKPYMPAKITQYLVTVIIFLFIFSSSLAVLDFIRGRKN